MSGARTLSRPARSALLLLLGAVAIGAALIPLGPGGMLVPPDLLYCLVIAWVLRAPDAAPVWLLVGLGLMADILLSRPIGLGALGLLLAAEVAGRNAATFRDLPFPAEWAAATLGYAAILAGICALLRLTFADTPTLHDLLRYLVATTLAYPLVALAVAWGVRLRAGTAARPDRSRERFT
jgi:rod shape-determining protein MreD